jgi:TatD DNase family protein
MAARYLIIGSILATPFAGNPGGRHNPGVPGLIDIGVNLTHDSFDVDRGDVVERAAEAGVTRMIVTGTSVTASAQAIELAASLGEGFYATAGVHPHHASEYDAHSTRALQELLAQPVVVAAGECGLDYFRMFSARDAQTAAFESQLALAAAAGKPVFLHQRDAHEDFVSILRSARASLVGGVAHCFTGGPGERDAYLDLDLYIGITGWVCDERRGEALRAALPGIPLQRVLLETDAPYLLPRDLTPRPKSRRNEPANLKHILERVAAGLGVAVEALADAAARNAETLFGLPPDENPVT